MRTWTHPSTLLATLFALALIASGLMLLMTAQTANAATPTVEPTGTDTPTGTPTESAPSSEPTATDTSTPVPSDVPSDTPTITSTPPEPSGSIDVPTEGVTQTPCWEGCHNNSQPPHEHITNPPTDTVGITDPQPSDSMLGVLALLITTPLLMFILTTKRTAKGNNH